MKKWLKGLMAALLALTITCGMIPGLDAAITAKAASGSASFDSSTKILTLKGNVTREQILKYRDNTYGVKKVVADDGCVLPADCSDLFAYYWFKEYWWALESVDLSKADASNVYTMENMFASGSKLLTVDISGYQFNTKNVTNMSRMFRDCTNLKKIYVGDNWNTDQVVSSTEMFYGCGSLIGGNGTTYNSVYVGISRARADLVGTPGYFTYNGDCTLVHYENNGGLGTMNERLLPLGQILWWLPECTLTPPTGKYFTQWDKGKVGAKVNVSGLKKLTLTPQWADCPTVTFMANGGEGMMQKVYLDPAATTYTLPECEFAPPSGYAFDAWDLGAPGTVINLNGSNVVLTAQWVKLNVVSFSKNGGSGTMNSFALPKGTTTYKLPNCVFTPPANKVFDKWNLGSVGTVIPISGDVILVAQWKYYVKANFNANGGSGTMTSVTLPDGTNQYMLPENEFTPPYGKVFYGWNLGQPGEKVTLSAGENTISAQWITLGKVIFSANGGSGTMNEVKPTSVQYVLPECTFTPPAGMTFDKWDVGYPGDSIEVGGSDVTVTAQWKNLDYPVICFTPNDYYSTGSMKNVYLAKGTTTYVLPECGFTPKTSDYEFAGWNYEGTTYQPGQTITVKAGRNEIKAKWWPTFASIEIRDPETSDVKEYKCYDDVYVFPGCPFTAPAGKKFAGYREAYYNLGTYFPGAEFPPEVFSDILPYYFKDYYIWTFDVIWADYPVIGFKASSEYSEGFMDAQELATGTTTYELPECGYVPKSGYKFAGWTYNGLTYQPGQTITVKAGMNEIMATWEKAQITTNEMYRLYNPNSGEHFYTAGADERDNLTSLGWNYEGVAWIAPVTSNTPVYRLYNPNAGDHHYTPSEQERDNLVAVGWQYEGIGWYSDDAKGVGLHRLYNPNAVAGAHHYTTSDEEKNNLVAIGWRYEGIGWYGVK